MILTTPVEALAVEGTADRAATAREDLHHCPTMETVEAHSPLAPPPPPLLNSLLDRAGAARSTMEITPQVVSLQEVPAAVGCSSML